MVCSCQGQYRFLSRLLNFGIRIIIFAIQIISFLYYTVFLIKYKIKIKYNIKGELIAVSIFWIIHRLIFGVVFLFYDCDYIDILSRSSIIRNYLSYFLDFVMFSVLIYYVLARKPKPGFQNHCDQQTLIRSFPEALYFWTPNFYFNAFLKKYYSDLLNYRPLLADILRYDFQIQEARISESIASSTVSADLALNLQLRLMQRTTSTVAPHPLSPQLQHVLNLANYIQERYLEQNSPQRCKFEHNRDVLHNIREKFKYLADNLDQFLFEFMRPCIESILTPVYKDFLNSQFFQELQKQVQLGQLFEWMLSIKQV